MSMVTRCPGCNTVFRVAPPQLQARQGKVRCGRCALVFDGFKALAAIPAEPAGEERQGLTTGSAQPAPKTPEEPAAAYSQEVAKSGEAHAIADDERIAATPPLFGQDTSEAREAMPQGAAAVVADNTGTPAPSQRHAYEEEELLPEPVPPRRGSPLWAVGSAVLVLLIALQAAYAYRTELASRYPGMKPVLTQMCAALGCSVPLPQRPRLINVEASDLQIVDPARPAAVQLTVTLRNHAGYDLGYPALDLVLTNTKEHTLARRIFLPEEYLERGKDARAGIPANAEVTLRLDLDTGDLGASGFRLDLLPAPAR
jgi:predicted Zn finger-like uncharacterized protein